MKKILALMLLLVGTFATAQHLPPAPCPAAKPVLTFSRTGFTCVAVVGSVGSATSGGVPAFTNTTTLTSSALLAANSPMLGGGVGAVPKTVAGITSDGVSLLTLGVAGVSVGGFNLKNATSGTIQIRPATGALGTVTITYPAATMTVSGAVGQSCGTTTTCSATNISTTMKIVTGSVALTSGSPSTAAITGINPAFTSASSYHCMVNNQTTRTNAVAVLAAGYVSGSAFTITGPNTVTDVVDYVCVGN